MFFSVATAFPTALCQLVHFIKGSNNFVLTTMYLDRDEMGTTGAEHKLLAMKPAKSNETVRLKWTP